MADNDDAYFVPEAPRSRRGRQSYDDLIERHARDNQIDPNLIRAVMSQESGGNPQAVSPKNARGLMQLIPATAARFGTRNIHDPDENIRGGARYLKFLNDRFKGNTDLVLAAYNAGEGAVEKFGNKIPPYRETQNYVPAVKSRYRQLGGQVQQQPADTDDPYFVPEQPSTPPVSTRTSGRSAAPRSQLRRQRQPQAPPINPMDIISQIGGVVTGQVMDAKRPQITSRADLMRAEEAPQASRGTYTVDPRLVKGEQPSDPTAYAKAQELVGRTEPIREVGGIRAGATAMGPRDRSVIERVGETINEYAPGIRSLDTPMGPKTDFLRGAASLGLANLRRDISPEEKLVDPNSGRGPVLPLLDVELDPYSVGQFAPAVVPYVGVGRAVSKIPALNAATREAHIARSALTFGGVELGRELTRAAQTGEPLNPKEVAISTAIGGGIGGLAGVNPSLKKQLVAFITPGVVADVARGTDPQTATFNALTNLAFGLYSYRTAPREVKAAAKVASEQLRGEGRETTETITPERRETGAPEQVTPRAISVEAAQQSVRPPLVSRVQEVAEPTRSVSRETQTEAQPPVQARESGRIGSEPRVAPSVQPATPAIESERLSFTSPRSKEYVEAYLSQYKKGREGISQGLERPDGSGEIVLRDAQGKPMGVAAYSPTAITDIVVSSKARRQGVASRLVGELRQRGISEFKGPFTEEGAALAAKFSTPEPVKPQWQHRDFGRVVASDDQAGVGRGRVRVTAEDGSEHVIQKPKGTGAGNQIAIPVRETTPSEAPAAEGGQKPPPTTAEIDGRTYTRRGDDWYNPEGKRVAGITKDKLDAASRPTEPATLPPAAVKPARKEAASQAETASPAPPNAREMNREQFIRYTDSVLQGFAERHGKGFAQKYKQAASRLFPAGDVVEYRYAGVVTKSGDKFLLNVLADTDSPAAKWRVADKIDVTDQFQPAAPKAAAKAAEPAPARVPPLKPPSVEPTKAREPSVTAPKDAAMQADRQALGLPELEQVPRVSAAEVLAKAKEANAKDARAADALIQQALAGGKNFNNVETMQVNLRAQEAKNRINALSDEIYKATDPQVIAEKRAEQDALIDEVGRISEAQDLAGAEWSRAGTARQRAINQDFDLVSMVVRMKKAVGRELTAGERTKIDEQARRITELETQLTAAQNKAQTAQLQKQIDRAKRQTKRGETKQVLDEEFAALKQQFVVAKVETRSGVQGSGLAALDPEGKLTVLIAKMARNRVKAGVVEAEKLVDEVYGAIKDKVEGLKREDVRDSILAYGFAEGRERTRQTQLLKTEADVTRRLAEKDFTRVERTPPVYTRETYQLQKRVDELKADFQRELYRAERGMRGRVYDTTVGAANLPKTLLSMADLSAVLRQGGVGVYQHPVLSGRAGVDMLRSFSERGFANVEAAIKAHKDFELARKSGVEFTGVDKGDPKLSHREEGFFGSDVLDTISRGRLNPLKYTIKPLKDFSERTFVSFLDSQRMRIFAHQAEQLRSMKLSPKELQDALKSQARYINIITGRGSLGRKGNQAAPLLNMAMFSPRLVASRFQLLNKIANPASYAMTPKGARQLQMIDNVKFAAGVVSTLALAKSAGADVNLDPDDSDFLKIKIGNARYDTLSGLQQPLRFLWRMAKASVSDEATYAGAPKADIAKDFARSKSAPTVGLTWDWLAGKNRLTGKKFEPVKDAIRTAIPLPLQDFREAIKQDGAVKGIVETLPALLGVGVQTYPLSPEKPQTHAEKLARKLIRDKMPDTARTEEEIEKSRAVMDVRARSRRGEDVSAELPKLSLSDRQTKSIIEAKGVPRFQEDFKRLGLEDALRVWSVASPAERTMVKPLLAKKADAVDQLDESKQSAVKAQLRAIGIVPVEELPAEKQREIRSQRRSESREQSRARREKQRSQGRQRPSLGYGY